MDYAADYGKLHAKGKHFPGYSICDYLKPLTAVIGEHQPERLLDYGSGRGLQYLKRRVHERWGGLLPYCYDIGVRGLDEKPEGLFDGVICTDVLEHIEQRDLPGVLDELIAFAKPAGFLFLVISCRPSRKRLPDRRDVHVTIKPPSWWKDLIAARVSDFPIRAIVHFDVAGHFDEPEDPWELIG